MADPVIAPVVKRLYGSKLTLDLDTSLPDAKPDGCLALTNVIRRNGRSLAKRPGTTMVGAGEAYDMASGSVYAALHNYSYESSSGGIITEHSEFLSLSANSDFTSLRIIQKYALDLTSSDATPEISILPSEDGGEWVVTLYNNGVAKTGWPKYYGDGVTPSGKDLSDLVSDISGTLHWTAVVSGGTVDTLPVAALGPFPRTAFGGVSLSVPFYRQNTTTGRTDLSVATGSCNLAVDADHKNLKGVNAANCAFIPRGKNLYPIKYDGLNAYKPGLPRALISGIADTGSGSTHAAGNSYIYRIGFWRVDNRDNQIYGPYSDDTLAVAQHIVGASASNITLSFYPISDNLETSPDVYTGIHYGPHYAQVNGLQAAVTDVTVDANYTVTIGDKVCVLSSGVMVERTVTAINSSTSIKLDAAVSVADNAIISNIRVQIQRTTNQGVDFFEVANIPNDPTLGASTAQTYVDSVADTSLGQPIEDQTKLPEPPLAASLCCIHQGLVVWADLADDPSGFAWNDPDWGFEAYPQASNRDQATGKEAGGITAIVSESDDVLAIFKPNSYFRVAGDLVTGQYTIAEVGDNDIGISSQASIVKLVSGIWGMSERGPALVKDGTISLEKSYGVLDHFQRNSYTITAPTSINAANSVKLVARRSTACYWPKYKSILFFIPAESGLFVVRGSTSSIKRFANSHSIWLCYDTVKEEWRDWSFTDTTANAHLAMAVFEDSLFFISSNSYDGSSLTRTSPNYIWRFLEDDSAYNYVDNVHSIPWRVRLQWESAGLPSSEKQMTQAKLYARHAVDFLAEFSVTFKEYRNGDLTTAYTEASRTFSADTDREKIIEPVYGDIYDNSVELYNSEMFECPAISGIELAYKITTSPEVKGIPGDG